MGRDKATLTVPGLFGGRSLVEQLVAVLTRRCAPVLVVAAAGQRLPELAARVLRDEVRGLGPLPAVGLGLAAAGRAGAEWAFVCAVDMPLLTAGLIDELAGAAAAQPADVVLPSDGRDHYLAGMYRTGLVGRIDSLTAAGERRLGALVDAVDVRRVAVVDSTPLVNLNSPADVAVLLSRTAAPGQP